MSATAAVAITALAGLKALGGDASRLPPHQRHPDPLGGRVGIRRREVIWPFWHRQSTTIAAGRRGSDRCEFQDGFCGSAESGGGGFCGRPDLLVPMFA